MDNEKSEQTLRVLAVIGFVITVCLLAWLAIQLVRFLPMGFSKLAAVFNDNQTAYQIAVRQHEQDNNNSSPDDEETNHIDDQNDLNDNNDVSAPTTNDDDNIAIGDVNTGVDNTVKDEKPATPTPVAPKPAPVQYRTVAVSKVPTSDPNGYTDLALMSLTFGTVDNASRFIPTTELSRKDDGAMQFVVKNVGTKTSTSWTFSVELPNGNDFNSKVQLPLKPSESATLTILFGDDLSRGKESARVKISGGNDLNTANNDIRNTVTVK